MSEPLPPGAFYDVPADWVDWADVDEAEAAPWPPDVEADARAKAALLEGDTTPE